MSHFHRVKQDDSVINYGKILLVNDGPFESSLIIDGSPALMTKIRSIFPNAKYYSSPGAYTKIPLAIPLTKNNLRDLEWVLSRYYLEMDQEVSDLIHNGAVEYEESLKRVREGYTDSSTTTYQNDNVFKISNLEPRPSQYVNYNIAKKRTPKFLNADPMGGGKTLMQMMIAGDPEFRPHLFVVKNSLTLEYMERFAKICPEAKVFYLEGHKKVDIPEGTDWIVTTYGRLNYHLKTLVDYGIKGVSYDEVQDLRNDGTKKYEAAQALNDYAKTAVGYSGTPFHNSGIEAFNILDLLHRGCLGDRTSFYREWCSGGYINDPVGLNKFLVSEGLLVKRTKKELGIPDGKRVVNIIRIKGTLEHLLQEKDALKILAKSVLKGEVKTKNDVFTFDMKLRRLTGEAKARSVAEIVKELVSEGKKVAVCGWHRSFYDILLNELKQLKVGMITGSETTIEKNKAKSDFKEGKLDVVIISHDSTAGIDGFQNVCYSAVVGELAWNKKVIDQFITRFDRPGQKEVVEVYYPVLGDGSDPVIFNLNEVKEGNVNGVVHGELENESEVDGLAHEAVGLERLKLLAKSYLNQIGEEVKEEVYSEATEDVLNALRQIKYPRLNEFEMQSEIFNRLHELLPDARIHREYVYSKRSRLDFLIEHKGERIILEAKNNSKNLQKSSEQVNRYINECSPNSLIIVGPWERIRSHYNRGIPVINFNINMKDTI